MIGGTIGAVLSTLMRIRYEREEQFRERMVAAADDFSTAALRAMLGLRDVFIAIEKVDANDVPATLDRSDDLINEAHARLPRVELLFGDESEAGHAAGTAIVALRTAWQALREWPSATALAQRQYQLAVKAARAEYVPAFDDVRRNHARFNRAALDEIRRPPWWRRRGGRRRAARAGRPD